ncbi:RAC-alpha serine/threonine-protein kinase [Ancistrocladus abbreviatus]
MLCCKPQLFTARTNQKCHLLRMNHTTFLNILQANVVGGTTIMSNLLQHMRDEKNPTMEKIVLQIDNMIGQHRIDLVTLCLTALRGEGLSDCVVVTISCLDKAEKMEHKSMTSR